MTETAADRLRELFERAKANAPDKGIDVTAVVEVPEKPKRVPAVPVPHTEMPHEREP